MLRPRTGVATPMTYDPELAARVREALAAEPGVSEQPMFGGIAFLVNGNMSVAASSDGGLMLRVDPTDAARLAAHAHAAPLEMRGTTMNGWLRIAPDGARTREDVVAWVAISLAYARNLRPKRGTSGPSR